MFEIIGWVASIAAIIMGSISIVVSRRRFKELKDMERQIEKWEQELNDSAL